MIWLGLACLALIGCLWILARGLLLHDLRQLKQQVHENRMRLAEERVVVFGLQQANVGHVKSLLSVLRDLRIVQRELNLPICSDRPTMPTAESPSQPRTKAHWECSKCHRTFLLDVTNLANCDMLCQTCGAPVELITYASEYRLSVPS